MTSRMRSNRRRLFRRLIAASVFGFAVTALLAFSPSIFRDHFESWYSPKGKPHRMQSAPTYLSGLVPDFEEARLIKPDHEFCGGVGRTKIFQYFVDIIEYSYGEFDREWDDRQSNSPPGAMIIRTRYGWPWRAMYTDNYRLFIHSERYFPTNEQYNHFITQAQKLGGLRTGIESPDFLPCKTNWHRIPIAPFWFGWLLDIVFWSTIWLLLSTSLHAVVRKSRTRRNRCPSCGYPLEDLTQCPECGTPRV